MLASLPLPATAGPIVTPSPLVSGEWDKKSRVALYRPGSGPASPKGMMSSNDEGPPRKRQVRPESRKVSELSAERLKRKRANDREAQRSIRQRTKEHIERLEKQVNGLFKRNASLEMEVVGLRHQLSDFTSYPAFPSGGDQAGSYQIECTIEGLNSAPSTQFPGTSHPPSGVPRASSTMSATSRSSYPQDWQQPYCSTRSPSLGDCSDTDFSARVDPHLVECQLDQPSPMIPSSLSPATSQPNFSNIASPTQSCDSSFPHIYPVGQYRGQLPEDQSNEFFSAQSVTDSQSTSAPYPSSYRSLALHAPQIDEYSYPWVSQT